MHIFLACNLHMPSSTVPKRIMECISSNRMVIVPSFRGQNELWPCGNFRIRAHAILCGKYHLDIWKLKGNMSPHFWEKRITGHTEILELCFHSVHPILSKLAGNDSVHFATTKLPRVTMPCGVIRGWVSLSHAAAGGLWTAGNCLRQK